MSQYVEIEYSESAWDNQDAQLTAWHNGPSNDDDVYQKLKEALDKIKEVIDEMRRQIAFNCVTLAIYNAIMGLPLPNCLDTLPELQ